MPDGSRAVWHFVVREATAYGDGNSTGIHQDEYLGAPRPAYGVQPGTPSFEAGASDVDPTKIAQVLRLDT